MGCNVNVGNDELGGKVTPLEIVICTGFEIIFIGTSLIVALSVGRVENDLSIESPCSQLQFYILS